MQDVGAKLSIAITAPLAALGVASFKAASDAAELESAFRQTFGSMSDEMQNFAETTGDAMGRSTQEIQNATNTFGIFFNQAAKTRQEAAKMSQTFAVLAQDLSSFYNTSPEVALEKLRSGLSGESEPLRDFGVFLNEAAVGQKALELGLASTTKELTEQQKIMARAALIMDATTNAQGDVARTADGTANRVRAARAAFEELSVAIGQKLIPALTPLVEGVTKALNAFNALPSGVQGALVAIGGIAAVLGPVVFIAGNLVQSFGVLKASMVTAGGAATGLRAAMVALLPTLGLVVGAVALIGAGFYLLRQRIDENSEASEEYRKREMEATKARDAAAEAARVLATATGESRRESIEATKATQRETRARLNNARAALLEAQAKARAAKAERDTSALRSAPVVSGRLYWAQRILGIGPDAEVAKAKANEASAQKTVDDLEAALKGLTVALNTPEPVSGTVSVPASSSGGKSGAGGPMGPSAADIEDRFMDELIGYETQINSARAQQAMNADERAEYELRNTEWARIQTARAIQNDEDYNEAQKAQLLAKVENLAFEERAGIELRRLYELERDAAEMAGVEFDNQREMLNLQADVTDTQADRKRLALDILRLEQEYRRNQLEMVVASQTASDAEKARAQAILDSLGVIERQQTEAVSRANETDVERYLREANKTPEQMGEARAGISLDGLDQLISGLSRIPGEVKSINDAFNTMRDVFQGVIQDMLAALIKLQLQKSLTSVFGSLLGGGGGGATGFASVLAGADFSGPFAVAGARAMGGPVSLGKTYLVGERGPELFTAGRNGSIIPNHELGNFGSVGPIVRAEGGPTFNITVNGPMSDDAARRTGTQLGAAAARSYAQARRTGLAG